MTQVKLSDINASEAMVELVDDNLKYVYRAAIRPELAKFAIEMEGVLRENDHKTGWDDMLLEILYHRIKEEFEEMSNAFNQIKFPDTQFFCGEDRKYVQEVRREAIDIANFCMFLCHNYPAGDDKDV